MKRDSSMKGVTQSDGNRKFKLLSSSMQFLSDFLSSEEVEEVESTEVVKDAVEAVESVSDVVNVVEEVKDVVEVVNEVDAVEKEMDAVVSEIAEEVVKEVMAALRKDANLSYQLGAKQTVMFDRVIACVGGDGARQA